MGVRVSAPVLIFPRARPARRSRPQAHKQRVEELIESWNSIRSKIYQAHKKSVDELIHFVDDKMLPPETASRIFKHVEFQASIAVLPPCKDIPDLHLLQIESRQFGSSDLTEQYNKTMDNLATSMVSFPR